MKKIIRQYSSEIHGNYFQMSIRYGMVIGALMSLGLLVRFIISKPASSPISYVDNVIMLVFMAFVVYLYRNSLENKKITFKEAWLVGFFSAFVASVIYGMFMYIYNVWIDTDMSARCMNGLQNLDRCKGYTIDQIKAMAGVSQMCVYSIIYNIIVGILWAFCVGIIFRNEKAQRK